MLERQKVTNTTETRKLKYSLWRNATGLNKIATNVDALFTFFAQRVSPFHIFYFDPESGVKISRTCTLADSFCSDQMHTYSFYDFYL